VNVGLGSRAPLVFALGWDRALGRRVSGQMGLELAEQEEREFEDGEHKIRPLVGVRDCDVYVLCSLHADESHGVDAKLCRLLFFVAALRDAGAARVTAVVPYLCYARKDRRTKPRDPVTTRYVACLFEAVGVDRIVTVDVHNLAAFQNASRVLTEHLEARWILARDLMHRVKGRDLVVVSPDVGGVKRADRFREALAHLVRRPVANAFIEKFRSEDRVTGGAVVGAVSGRVAVLVDDLVSSGTTMIRAARACIDAGSTAVHAVATHGLFVGDATTVLASNQLTSLAVTDTIPPFRLSETLLSTKVRLLDVAPLLAEAIRRLHEGGSIIDLVEHGPPP
jgi:ribose-phosphate pyrophosphokinase